MSTSQEEPASGRDLDPLLALVDSSVGLMSLVARTAVRPARTTRRLTSPLLRGVEGLPVVRSRPRVLSGSLVRRGALAREHATTRATSAGNTILDRIVPLVLEEVLRRVDLTDVVRRHVDLNLVAGDLDLDAAAARLDVDAVAARLDLATIVSAAIAQVDLAAIAQEVVEAVDLPEIIRDSSGALTSETVQGARIRSAAADQALGRVRDRLLPHRNGDRVLVDQIDAERP